MPRQGEWNEADFFELHTNRMAELVNGRLEVLPMPTWFHQLIVDFFVDVIKAYLKQNSQGGVVLFAPLPTRLFPGTIREPDVLYVVPQNLPRKGHRYPEKLDFVVEVVSDGVDTRERDYEHKRVDYAKAGIAEYWIVDPVQRMITVLSLAGEQYETLGCFRENETARGKYFEKLCVEVSAVMALENMQSFGSTPESDNQQS